MTDRTEAVVEAMAEHLGDDVGEDFIRDALEACLPPDVLALLRGTPPVDGERRREISSLGTR